MFDMVLGVKLGVLDISDLVQIVCDFWRITLR